jgi:cytochrome c553
MESPYRQLGAWSWWVFLTPAIAVGAQAEQRMPDGRTLFASCAECHQLNAWGSPDGAIPSLAGQQRHYLEKQLAVFRSAARVNTAMQVVTAHPSFSDQGDIGALARYLSGLDANPNPVVGSGEHLRVGQELYTHLCAPCHGVDGGGEGSKPRIAGQHYPYLRRQIEAAARLHRNLAPPEMTRALESMHAQEKDALADYIARLGRAEALLDTNRPHGAHTDQPP